MSRELNDFSRMIDEQFEVAYIKSKPSFWFFVLAFFV